MNKLIFSLLALTFAACGQMRPVTMHSDPNEERRLRMEERTQDANDAAVEQKKP